VPGEFVGDQAVGRDVPPEEALEGSDLAGLQAMGIAEDADGLALPLAVDVRNLRNAAAATQTEGPLGTRASSPPAEEYPGALVSSRDRRAEEESRMGTTPREIAALLLAAGQGTRMKSALAKVLHPIAGRPMLHYPLAAAEALHPRRLIVVVGRDAEQVGAAVGGRAELVLQSQQRGTGHAVLQTARTLEGFRGDVLILYGDTPLLRAETLERMRRHKAETGADLVLLSAKVAVPGIVVRDAAGKVARIVEATDASPAELAIEERNTGVYLLGAELLWKMLAQVGDQNRQGEIYLKHQSRSPCARGSGRGAPDPGWRGGDRREPAGRAGACGRRGARAQVEPVDAGRCLDRRSGCDLDRRGCGDRARRRDRAGLRDPGRFADRRAGASEARLHDRVERNRG
jgi:CTP:molybdopterin cytidylyltransferase MocA